MAKLESNLKKKLNDLKEEYQDKAFNSACSEQFQNVRVYLEVTKVLDQIIELCQNRGRF